MEKAQSTGLHRKAEYQTSPGNGNVLDWNGSLLTNMGLARKLRVCRLISVGVVAKDM